MRNKKGQFLPGISYGGAAFGNKHAYKLKTSELKVEAYRQYCEWLSQGRSKEAWVFQHPEISLTSRTMEKYIRDNPVEFPPIHKEIAEAKSYEHWLDLGKRMMLGQVEKCQPAIYQMFMRNKFGWDKEKVEEVVECAADRILEAITVGKLSQ